MSPPDAAPALRRADADADAWRPLHGWHSDATRLDDERTRGEIRAVAREIDPQRLGEVAGTAAEIVIGRV